MERELISKKLSRFSSCDTRFFPYIEKVLMRLPEKICQSFLDDLNYDMVSFGEAFGPFYEFPSEIRKLIILNEENLKQTEFQIIHTIACGIAHKTIGKGESLLYEKEAEELLVEWGFQEEVEKVDYTRPWFEGDGYKIGFEWASNQTDLSRFENYYNEWDQGEFVGDTWEELYYEVDADSILDEMQRVGGKKPVDLQEIGINEGSLGKGIIYGIMGYLKKKRVDALRNLSESEISEHEKDELFWVTLKDAVYASDRLNDPRIQLAAWQCAEEYPEINTFLHSLIEMKGLLEKLEKK